MVLKHSSLADRNHILNYKYSHTHTHTPTSHTKCGRRIYIRGVSICSIYIKYNNSVGHTGYTEAFKRQLNISDRINRLASHFESLRTRLALVRASKHSNKFVLMIWNCSICRCRRRLHLRSRRRCHRQPMHITAHAYKYV